MSYILDALRRAEAERERGSVPGLHSPGLPAGGAAPVPPPPHRAPSLLLWLAAALVLALLGAALGAWWAGAPGRTGPVAAPPAAAAVPGQATLPQGDTVAAARAEVPVPLQLPTPPAQATVAAAPAAPPAGDGGTPPVQPAANPPVNPAPRPAAPMGVVPPPAVGAVPPSATAGDSPVVPLAALSAEQRAAWPALAVGGSIYSDNPGSRFVIANGQVVREGETAAPGVTVERIGRSAVVLRWRGLRVELPL